ncbi:hypothetical protein OQA88_13262 [Cercophora sp. LCS_1]
MPLETKEIRMQDHVYEGIWIDHGEPMLSRCKWTVGNSEAICILALFTTLLSCTQGRAWVISRRLAHKWLYRAAAPSGENRRTNPSQGDAVLDLIRSIGLKASEMVKHRPGGRTGPQTRNLSSHPVFGTAALLNAFAFIAMGVAVPYLLSEGGIGAPIVRSKGGPDCRHDGLGTYSIRSWGAIQQSAIEVDLIGRLCWEAPRRAHCPDFALPWKLSSHRLEVDFSSQCPFEETVCTEGENQSFLVTRMDITARHLGINTAHRGISMNQALECAPVRLDRFLHHRPDIGTVLSVAPTVGNKEEEPESVVTTHMLLDSKNGLRTLHQHKPRGPRDMTILPHKPIQMVHDEGDTNAHLLHPDLQQRDAEAFLVVYWAGPTGYDHPVNDALFNASLEKDGYYYAHREATAIGCAERFQFCASRAADGQQDECTAWGPRQPAVSNLTRYLHAIDMPNGNGFVSEIVYLYEAMAAWQSIYRYLSLRTREMGQVPLRTWFDIVQHGYYPELLRTTNWQTEVTHWFRLSILDAMLLARNGIWLNWFVLNSTLSHDMSLGKEKVFLCDRILFHDIDHVNVNVVGLCATLIALAAVWIISFL